MMSKRDPVISVVVCSFNHGHFIRETLQSIVDQTYPHKEIIVIDGGSQDGTAEILQEFASQLAFWVSEKDEGQTDALIKGFSHATGDILCWLNSDDLFELGALEQVAAYFVAHPKTQAVYGDALWIDAQSQPLREQREIPFSTFILAYTYNYIPGMSMFWRREAFEKAGGLDRSFRCAMDFDLWSRISLIGKIGHVKKIWSRMRRYPEQISMKFRQRCDYEDCLIRVRHYGEESDAVIKMKRKAAMAWRLLWKVTTGCYSTSYRREVLSAKR
jgi:glycosyltransferase involved in cell wall biosynthesis